jgi:hypothetical protein
MALACALILINSHGIIRKISTLLGNIPCFSVCFRGEWEVKGDDTTQVNAIRVSPMGVTCDSGPPAAYPASTNPTPAR